VITRTVQVPTPPRWRSARRIAGVVGVASAAATILVGLAWGPRASAPAAAFAPPIAAAEPAPVQLLDEPAPPVAVPAPAAPDPVPTAASAAPSSAGARPRPVGIGGPRISCDPPYSVDADGIRHYKKGCLR
jgi:serine/threonine-protein kinase